MTAICVDGEALLAERAAEMCRALPEIGEALPFTRGGEALDWLQRREADLALLETRLPDGSGLELAKTLRQRYPAMKIIFLTDDPGPAAAAFRLHVSGYLLKPADPTALAEEVSYALSERMGEAPAPRVTVRTFGGFDVFAEGRLVSFRLSRSKELLALLVDRRGLSLTRAEAFALLWEDRLYDRSMQKQFDVIIRSMRKTLREYGIEGIVEMKSGRLRICPERLDCDMYRFFEGDVAALNAYRGEYMSAYAWADLAEGYLTQRWGG